MLLCKAQTDYVLPVNRHTGTVLTEITTQAMFSLLITTQAMFTMLVATQAMFFLYVTTQAMIAL